MRNNEKQCDGFLIVENILELKMLKEVNIKLVQVYMYIDWLKIFDICYSVNVNGFFYNDLFFILLLNYLLRYIYVKFWLYIFVYCNIDY